MVHSVLQRLPKPKRTIIRPTKQTCRAPSPLLGFILYSLGQIKSVPMVLTNPYGNDFKQTWCWPGLGRGSSFAPTLDPDRSREPRHAGDTHTPARLRAQGQGGSRGVPSILRHPWTTGGMGGSGG